MIQGTMSNVGKSLITAGLCRIFAREGYRVAPFKGQNMALNSYITKDGLEMGRAQVMQAECARVKPDVRMNPVLLKPVDDTGSQVIVNGEVLGTMSAADYFKFKPKLTPVVQRAYESLAEENDLIIIEGAGSPAEINLKDADCFVNMGMAKIASAPVILVGDIDRGGVFAQLEGTVRLLDPRERSMVKGMIINKFRGDLSLLDPGIEMIERITGKAVLGTVPYMDLDVDDEDSLAERLKVKYGKGAVDIAVIRTPRISNFTDFNAFDQVIGASLRYCTNVAELGDPDMIILPGSKNTMGDLRWMRANGLEEAVVRKAMQGVVIFGICGGYQMLGESLTDPVGAEGGGTMAGMGLLPVKTTFTRQKTRMQVRGKLGSIGGALAPLSGMEIEGYELHMGVTALKDEHLSLSLLERISTDGDGTSAHPGTARRRPVFFDGAQNGNIYGTYVHGIFDKNDAAGKICRALAAKKGIRTDGMTGVDYGTYKDRQYDKLADQLIRSLDMHEIRQIIDRGIL
jgi:adenosylcobyric acid synthase